MTGASHKAAGPADSAFNSESRDRQSVEKIAAPVTIFTLAAARRPQHTRLPRDPVCRMAIDPIRAAAVHHFAESSIHFRAADCADLSQQHPERYQTMSA